MVVECCGQVRTEARFFRDDEVANPSVRLRAAVNKTPCVACEGRGERGWRGSSQWWCASLWRVGWCRVGGSTTVGEVITVQVDRRTCLHKRTSVVNRNPWANLASQGMVTAFPFCFYKRGFCPCLHISGRSPTIAAKSVRARYKLRCLLLPFPARVCPRTHPTLISLPGMYPESLPITTETHRRLPPPPIHRTLGPHGTLLHHRVVSFPKYYSSIQFAVLASTAQKA